MVHNHLERCPVGYTIREFQIKAKGYDYKPMRMPKTSNTFATTNSGKDKEPQNLHSLMVRVQDTIAVVDISLQNQISFIT